MRALRAAAVALLLVPAAHAQSPSPLEQLAATDDAVRRHAARELLRNPLDQTSAVALASILRAGNEQTQLLLTAIAESATPPPALEAVLIDLLPGSARPRPLFRALAAYATPTAAAALLSYARAATLSTEIDAHQLATNLLQSMLGLPSDATHDQIQAEINAITQAGPDAWQRRVQQARLDTIIAQRAELVRLRTMLTDQVGRLYVALPPQLDGPRDRLLTDLLAASEPALRDTALQIIARNASEGTTPSPTIAAATLALLASPDRDVRLRVASLARQIATARDLPTLEAAASTEQDPRVLSFLLTAAARWPTASLQSLALRALDGDAMAHPGAIDLLDAADRAPIPLSPELRRELSTRLARLDPATAPTPALPLIARLGTDQDRARIAALIDTLAPGAQRIAAAAALSQRPEYQLRILTAAQSDATLFAAAVTAATAQPVTLATYRALQSLPAPSPAMASDALRSASTLMSVQDLLVIVAESAKTPQARVDLLLPLTFQGPIAGPVRPTAEPAALTEALVILAESLLALDQPSAALGALDAIPREQAATPAVRPTRLRLFALLRTNQIEPAIALEALATDWLDGLEANIAQPHAPAIATTIRNRFARALSTEQRSRLDALNARLEVPDEP